MNTVIYPNEEIRITMGAGVLLHFEVATLQGVVIDSTFDKEPAQLVIGDGNLPAGFEKILMGLKVGDIRTAHLPPQDAFGEHNVANVQRFLPAQFALTDCPRVGMMIEFSDKGNNAVVGVITKVQDDEVVVDFNHPLAGQTVLFKVEILQVTPKGQTAIKIS